MQKLNNYINGQLSHPINDAWLENINPATGQIVNLIPDSDASDVNLAMESARKAFPDWSATPAAERSRIMLRLAELMENNLDKLAKEESIDSGKPFLVSKTIDIPRAISNIRFFATAILHIQSESHATDQLAINFTLRQAVGVAVCISPWNLPLYLFTWKIAPALASGNTVVAKPSELTPMTASSFSALCIEAGLPAGVLNIVQGLGHKAGAAMVAHEEVDLISFTGGTKTGATIASVAAPKFKKLSLELGGKNASIVFADCEFENTVKETVRAAFSNQGQICLCGSRLLIERSIYDRFKTAFIEEVKTIQVGNPFDESSRMGSVISEAHMDKIISYIDLAKQEGGQIISGGNRIYPPGNEGGFFLEPTVIEGLGSQCRVNQEEIFGPVVSLIPFDADNEAIAIANGTEYGLAFSVWTSNLTRAHRLSADLKTGIVWVNCWMLRDLRTPFGGVKNSGVGREGGWEALRFFTEAKNVCIKL
ncbi:MAG: aldehyde dehydrogenase [Bacteroidia bacterium]